MDDVVRKVKERLQKLGLSVRNAAEQIGVTSGSLERHLAGAYVRSDSLGKYRTWLEGRRTYAKPRQPVLWPRLPDEETQYPDASSSMLSLQCTLQDLPRPFKVVDLFSGCGGMSLGFELVGRLSLHTPCSTRSERPNRVFETILALDVEKRVVQLHNENHTAESRLVANPARWIDLSQFLNEAEILAFYLDHLSERTADIALQRGLDELSPVTLREFKVFINQLDATFLSRLAKIRASEAFWRDYRQVNLSAFGQTSVIGFHENLGLPSTNTGSPLLGPMIWAQHASMSSPVRTSSLSAIHGFSTARRETLADLDNLWEAEIEKLRLRTGGKGRGQLASSAARITEFLKFLSTDSGNAIRSAWRDWRGARDALRVLTFGDDAERRLRSLYAEPHKVDVLLGGPPCQGFSRIGRGKIRSLREHHVHVESDAEAGDARNLLLLKYVLFISALEPRVFLFENVRHFQASVKTHDGTFEATEILNEAIQDLSGKRLTYRVKDRIVDCSRHLIPQKRERFVMAGIRADIAVHGLSYEELPGWCLTLPTAASIPLKVALEDLPAPLLGTSRRNGEEAGGVSGRVSVPTVATERPNGIGRYLRWIRQATPLGSEPLTEIDGHYVRESRVDDREFFDLLGPGRRWMDYRCDDTPTLRKLQTLLDQVKQVKKRRGGDVIDIDSDLLEEVCQTLNGSLSLRLLLESISPREGELQHHLLAAGYLAKRNGNNGDWISRLDPNRPCKTIVSHMAKDTYAYVHPSEPRTLSVREAARIQTFPDWFSFGSMGLVDAYRAIGNAVPPLLSYQFAERVAQLLATPCRDANVASDKRDGRFAKSAFEGLALTR